MNYTPEQNMFRKSVIDPNDTSHVILRAVAGSGKTTTILSPLKEIQKRVAIIAFNKSIAKEIEEKVAKMNLGGRVQSGTCHSYGFRAYKESSGERFVNVDGNKVSKIIDQYFLEKDFLPVNMKPMIRKLVSIGKQNGADNLDNNPHMGFDMYDYRQWAHYIYHHDINDSDSITDEELIKHTINVLDRSNKIKNVIDFDDMIYLPLRMRLKFPRFDYVMIDEAQDVNWARRAMAGCMLERERYTDENGKTQEKITGRLIAVGDDRQAIYGFTGAGADSLDQIKRDYNAEEFGLTFCFRCDKNIVKFAQRWNPRIQHSDTAGEGEVINMEMKEFMKQKHDKKHVMLCRNTKPLVATAFAMIREGIAVYVEGRDIGEGLKRLAERWKIKRIDTLVERLDGYRLRETKKALEKDDSNKVQFIEDQVGTLMVIIDRCLSNKKTMLTDVIDEINHLFKDTDGNPDRFTLSTIHKAKGREWDTVYWLDREGTLPSRYAKQPWQLQQESNLCYVAATRAKHRLIEVYHNDSELENDKGGPALQNTKPLPPADINN